MLARRNRERPVRIHGQRPQHHHIVLHHCWQRKNLATQHQSGNGRRHRSRHGSRKEQQVPLRIRQRRPRNRSLRSTPRRQPHMATDDQRDPSRSRRTSSKLNPDLFVSGPISFFLHSLKREDRSPLPLENSHYFSSVQREPKYGSSLDFFLGSRKSDNCWTLRNS